MNMEHEERLPILHIEDSYSINYHPIERKTSFQSFLTKCYSNQYFYCTLASIIIGTTLIVLSTCIVIVFEKFLHDSAQCSNVELTFYDSESFYFDFSADKVKKFTLLSNGITKTIVKRSTFSNDTLMVVVNRYSQSQNGYKQLNTTLVYDRKMEHLILQTVVPINLLKSDCVFVERTISIPASLLDLDIVVPASVGDVEFLRHVGSENNETTNFAFKSLNIARHSGEIILHSVYCSDVVNVSTHHGNINLRSVYVQNKGIFMGISKLGDLSYDDLKSPIVLGTVHNGEVKGQFIRGMPVLKSVSFETIFGSQSHMRVVNASLQDYKSDIGNIKLVMKTNDFVGQFYMKAGKAGSVIINHYSKNQITYTIDNRNEKSGTISPVNEFGQLHDSKLHINVASKGNINAMLEI
jgi:hypothetical protein